MARGWESKAIEQQQDEAVRARQAAPGRQPPVDPRRLEARRSLELSRARTVQDLQRATRPAHRAMLEQALEALETQLRALEP